MTDDPQDTDTTDIALLAAIGRAWSPTFDTEKFIHEATATVVSLDPPDPLPVRPRPQLVKGARSK